MPVTIMFRNQAEQKCRQYKSDDSFFARRENQTLAESIKFGTPV